MDVLREPLTERRQPQSRGALVAALAAVALIAAVVAAVIGSMRSPVTYDRATPEGVVQAYVQAVLDDDVSTARGFLSDELADSCTAAEFRHAWVPRTVTASLDDVRLQGDRAEVDVRMHVVEGPPPFGGGGTSSTEVFTLARVAGRWQLTETPWPLYGCGGST